MGEACDVEDCEGVCGMGVAEDFLVFVFCCCACLWESVVAIWAVGCLDEGRVVVVILRFVLHAGVDVFAM